MAKEYNWAEIKAIYENSETSLNELSKKHGFNYSYGCRKMRTEKWVKRTEEVHKEAQKRIYEEEVDKKEVIMKFYDGGYTKIGNDTFIELRKEKPDFDKLKCLKISAEILSICRKEKYELNGIQELAKRVEHAGGLNIEINITGDDDET